MMLRITRNSWKTSNYSSSTRLLVFISNHEVPSEQQALIAASLHGNTQARQPMNPLPVSPQVDSGTRSRTHCCNTSGDRDWSASTTAVAGVQECQEFSQ